MSRALLLLVVLGVASTVVVTDARADGQCGNGTFALPTSDTMDESVMVMWQSSFPHPWCVDVTSMDDDAHSVSMHIVSVWTSDDVVVWGINPLNGSLPDDLDYWSALEFGWMVQEDSTWCLDLDGARDGEVPAMWGFFSLAQGHTYSNAHSYAVKVDTQMNSGNCDDLYRLQHPDLNIDTSWSWCDDGLVCTWKN